MRDLRLSAAHNLFAAISRNGALQSRHAGVSQSLGAGGDTAVSARQCGSAHADAVGGPRNAGQAQRRDKIAAGKVEHRAVAGRPPPVVVPKRLPLPSGPGRVVGVGAVEVEGGRGCDGVDSAGCPGHLEHRAVADAALLVVPKRLPLLSSTRPATGKPPLVPLKEARVVMVPLPRCLATSNTVPSPIRAAAPGGAEEIAAAVLDQAGEAPPLVPSKEARAVMVPPPAARPRTPYREPNDRRLS